MFALEQIVQAPAPTEVRLGDDVALDEALASLGLDPLPVPAVPATIVCWIDDGGWKVAGVLLDGLEATFRAPRLEDVLDDSPPGPPTATLLATTMGMVAAIASTGEIIDYVEPPDRLAIVAAAIGADELVVRRSNAAATRVLLVPDAPIAPDPTDPILRLDWLDRGVLRSASRYLSTEPRLVSQEWP